MDTLSCKWCKHVDVCLVVRKINKSIGIDLGTNSLIITGTGEVKHKIYKILASNCLKYSYEEK